MSARPGVVFLDHTADVGVAVSAPDLRTLFQRAAHGMLDLLRGVEDEPDPPAPGPPYDEDERTVAVEADGPPRLLADWLREILYLHEVEHRDYVSARFDRLDPGGLSARVRTRPALGAVREIKGVTYHELAAERTDTGWSARVIFDV